MRRRRRTPDDPETVAVYEAIEEYVAAQEALAAMGDRFARDRIRGAAFTRKEIRQWGLCFVTRLRVEGYERETARITGSEGITADLQEFHPFANGL